jgi:tetratricopeptide (TPR) repeat protein
LDGAVLERRHNLQQCPLWDIKRADLLNDLALALVKRFQQLGRIDDLEEAIAHFHDALALHPPGHQDHSASLNNLGNAISTRFQQLGQMEDLEEAIKYHRRALALRSPGHPGHSTSLKNLANTISARFEQLGQMRILRRPSRTSDKLLLFTLLVIQIAAHL